MQAGCIWPCLQTARGEHEINRTQVRGSSTRYPRPQWVHFRGPAALTAVGKCRGREPRGTPTAAAAAQATGSFVALYEVQGGMPGSAAAQHLKVVGACAILGCPVCAACAAAQVDVQLSQGLHARCGGWCAMCTLHISGVRTNSGRRCTGRAGTETRLPCPRLTTLHQRRLHACPPFRRSPPTCPCSSSSSHLQVPAVPHLAHPVRFEPHRLNQLRHFRLVLHRAGKHAGEALPRDQCAIGPSHVLHPHCAAGVAEKGV